MGMNIHVDRGAGFRFHLPIGTEDHGSGGLSLAARPSFYTLRRWVGAAVVSWLVVTAACPAVHAQTGPGQALNFGASDQRLTVQDRSLAAPWTVECWVRRRPSSAVSAPLWIGPKTALKLEQYGTNGHVGFTEFGRADYEFPYTAPANEWVHLAMVAASGETCLYVNGALHSCVPASVPLPLNFFGGMPGATGEQLRGDIDEVRVWQSERSAPDVADNRFRRLNGREPGLVGYWRFDEGSGGTGVASNSAAAHPDWSATLTGVGRVNSAAPFWPEFGAPQFVAGDPGRPDLTASIHGGNLATTVLLQVGDGASFVNAGSAAVLPPADSARVVAFPVSVPSDGRAIYGRLVASNVAGVTMMPPVPIQLPILRYEGTRPWTGKCQEPFVTTGVVSRLAPVAVSGGAGHSAALRADGRVVAWGLTDDGQANVPAAASNVVAVAASRAHTLALTSEGRVIGWGRSREGQLGIPPELTAVAIASSEFFSVALRSDGGVVAWGESPNGETNVPAILKSGVIAIASGRFHNLALRANGRVVGWGRNVERQTTIPAVATNIIAVAAGGMHSLALTAGGRVLAWGDNSSGQTNVPANATNVIAIAAGEFHSLALRADGRLVAWGWSGEGQTNLPAEATNIVAIAAGYRHNLAVRGDGAVLAWGRSDLGQTQVPAAAVRQDAPFTVEPGSFPVPVASFGVTLRAANLAGSIELVVIARVLDTVGPDFQLLGSLTVEMLQDDPWIEPGYTVTDPCDPSPSVTTSGLNTAIVGEDVLTYEARDASRNVTRRQRIVIVRPRPVVVALPEINGPSGAVTLRASVDRFYGLASVYFRYGQTTNYGGFTETNVIGNLVGAVEVSRLVTGLMDCREWHAQLVVRTSAGTVFGPDERFSSTSAPGVYTLPASGIGTNGATLIGAFDLRGAPGRVWFELGPTETYGQTTPPIEISREAFPDNLSSAVTNLGPGVYYYRAVGSNCAATVYGAAQTFRVSTVHVVTSSFDSGPGSLRAVLEQAQGGDVITFSVPGKTVLVTNELRVDKVVSLVGAGGDETIISALDLRTRIFHVAPEGFLTIEDLQVLGGHGHRGAPSEGGNLGGPGEGGGGIFNEGQLIANRCLFLGNAAGAGGNGPFPGGGGSGGAIDNRGLAEVNDCTFLFNDAGWGGTGWLVSGSAGHGGAIFNEGELTVRGCIFHDNSAGDASFEAGGSGGGLANIGGATALVVDCTFYDNVAGDGRNGGDGGGIFNTGTLEVSNCTIHGNRAGTGSTERGGYGGGIFNDDAFDRPSGILEVRNCTITTNEAAGNKIFDISSYGRGGGVYSLAAYALIENTIVAENTTGRGVPGPDVGGELDLSHCLVGVLDSAAVLDLNVHVVTNSNPGLAPLGNYGGRVPTRALRLDSPAIDAGDDGVNHSATDARGYQRVAGAGIDLGAYELQPATLPLQIQRFEPMATNTVRLAFTNTPGGRFEVWATTNVNLPRLEWMPVGAAHEVTHGEFEWTDTLGTGDGWFYELRSR